MKQQRVPVQTHQYVLCSCITSELLLAIACVAV